MLSTEQKRLSLPTGVVPSKPFHGLLMTSFALPERPKSRRAKYPKVRTGCVSCKRRHVKCDETKPYCNRCLKWSGACDGYEPTRSPSHHPKSTTTTHVKEPSVLEPFCTADERPSFLGISPLEGRFATPSTAGGELATPPFLHSDDTLDCFSEQSGMLQSGDTSMRNTASTFINHSNAPTASCVGGTLNTVFWTDTVPRLMGENLAVRHANMAVHMLMDSKHPEFALQRPPNFTTNHYSLASTHYGLALKQMQSSHPVRGGVSAAVLCSMLFAVFEALNGDREAAESHLLCGQRLLNELQHPLVHGSLRRELGNLLKYLALHVRIKTVVCWTGDCDALCTEYLGELAWGGPGGTSPE